MLGRRRGNRRTKINTVAENIGRRRWRRAKLMALDIVRRRKAIRRTNEDCATEVVVVACYEGRNLIRPPNSCVTDAEI
ncbi:hypothetical protein C1H46_011148 [Malus baccata]|uniref:Uncharacterized protein n=1 Tax=Malus baccata TaxID=106549 RepID=A0A540MWU5_MALBA|nr:hypothetical protein C1H46_011148 [Malus baccata]